MISILQKHVFLLYVSLHMMLDWIIDLKIDNVNFALIQKNVVDQFKSGIEDNSEYGCIISACKHLFQNNFQNSYVEFNRRQANETAVNWHM